MKLGPLFIAPFLAAALAAAALAGGAVAQGAAGSYKAGYEGVPPSVRPHCLSVRPGLLALTPAQTARIRRIVRIRPDGPARRAAIMRVLTRTQWMLYWRLAGVEAC